MEQDRTYAPPLGPDGTPLLRRVYFTTPRDSHRLGRIRRKLEALTGTPQTSGDAIGYLLSVAENSRELDNLIAEAIRQRIQPLVEPERSSDE